MRPGRDECRCRRPCSSQRRTQGNGRAHNTMVKANLLVTASPGHNKFVDELRNSGFALTYASSMGEAVRRVVTEQPDAVLAVADDAGAPQFCEVLRALGSFPL